MKILFVNLPYQGHVIPTLGLVRELIHLGCDVTYLLPFGWEHTVAESGARFLGCKNHRQLAEQMKYAFAAAEAVIEEFDLVVYEQFFFLGRHLAEKHRKPAVRIFTAPVTNAALMQEFIQTGPLSLFRCKWIARAFTKDVAGDLPLKTDNWLDEIIQNPPELNLVYTLRQYQPYEAEFPENRYKFLGPSVWERMPRFFGFKKGDRPLVYISLGSILKGKASFFRTCMEAFREENVDVVLSVGEDFDIRKLKNIPSNVHVFPSVPQTEVLQMADVFVTHGGMNSVSEALVAATPMVVIPFVSDQPVNAETVSNLGVGRKLKPSAVTAENLKNAVFSLMDDDRARGNLRSMQQLISQSPGNRGGAKMILRYCKLKETEDLT